MSDNIKAPVYKISNKASHYLLQDMWDDYMRSLTVRRRNNDPLSAAQQLDLLPTCFEVGSPARLSVDEILLSLPSEAAAVALEESLAQLPAEAASRYAKELKDWNAAKGNQLLSIIEAYDYMEQERLAEQAVIDLNNAALPAGDAAADPAPPVPQAIFDRAEAARAQLESLTRPNPDPTDADRDALSPSPDTVHKTTLRLFWAWYDRELAKPDKDELL